MQQTIDEPKQNHNDGPLVDRSRWTQLLLVGAVLFVLVLYLYGTVQQALYVNHGGTDQGSYLRYTQNLYSDPTYIDGNRMPLFPFIVRLFYQPSMSDATLFELGKVVGIGVSLIALTAVALIFYHYFRGLLAVNLILITTFTVFVFKAPYYQPELLFFTLYFIAFVLMCRAFKRLTPRSATIIGLVLGLAMLAKASAATTLVLFVMLMVAQTGVIARTTNASVRRQRVLKTLGSVALVVIVFLIMLSSYMASSRRIFGPLFYNVNTTFYMWYDSWDEVKLGTRAHGDRVGWPDMPDSEIPSMSRYLAEHRPRVMFNRVMDGLRVTYSKHCTYDYNYAFGYCKYVAGFGVAAVVVAALNLPLMFQALKRNFFLVLFCLGFLVLHLLLSAWWVPISPGRRFLLALFLPLMFVLASILSLPGLRHLSFRLRNKRIDVRTLFYIGVLLAVAVDTYLTVTARVLWMYGGD